MAETDRDCGLDDPAESLDILRLLTGIREPGDSFRMAFRVPEFGGVG
jgi:hypothetical protein